MGYDNNADVKRYAPAASNYSENGGLIAVETAVASGKPRCALATDGSKPPFVIEKADNENGGLVSCIIWGWVQVIAGDTFTPGTNGLVMANAAGKAIPATDGNYYLGRAFPEETISADEPMWVFVSPGYLKTT